MRRYSVGWVGFRDVFEEHFRDHWDAVYRENRVTKPAHKIRAKRRRVAVHTPAA